MQITSRGNTVSVEGAPRVLAVGVPRGLGPRFADSSTPGMPGNVTRVSNLEALDGALRQGDWAAVVEERGAGSIDPVTALAVLRERLPKVPVLFLDSWNDTRAPLQRAVDVGLGLITDAQGCVRAVGGASQRFLGYPGGQVLGRPLATLFSRDQVPVVVELRTRCRLWVGAIAGPRMIRVPSADARPARASAWAQDLEWVLGLSGTLMLLRVLER